MYVFTRVFVKTIMQQEGEQREETYCTPHTESSRPHVSSIHTGDIFNEIWVGYPYRGPDNNSCMRIRK